MPEPDFEDQTSGAKFYSADRLAEYGQALERRITAAFERKYGPVEADYRGRSLRAQADESAAKTYEKVSAYPSFKDHEKDIAAAMQADDALSVQDAYIQVVVPKLSQMERSQVAASLVQKTAAASANPAGTATASPRLPKTFAEALARSA
jgi:hypothetical protein